MANGQFEKTSGEWTVEEYLQLDEGVRCELLDGEFVARGAPTVAHQYTTARIGTIIDSIAMAYDLGFCLDPPTELLLSRDTVVQPDLTFFRAEAPLQTVQSHLIAGVPRMVVEVTGSTTIAQDRGKKRGLYAEAGIPWLLLIDYGSQTAETYHCSKAEAYAWEETASNSETLEFPPYPELSIDLSRIWPPPPLTE